MESTIQGASSLPGLTNWILAGGPVMVPLLILSLIVWAIIIEKLWRDRRLGRDLDAFHLEATNALLRKDTERLKKLCLERSSLPTSQLVSVALERLTSNEPKIRAQWWQAVDRRRQLVNQGLRQNLWILGTVASASPFVGLFGTVVGILQSFGHIAQSGTGGFAVVAGGISEALVATAAGIFVAVVALMAYNFFQTRWSRVVLVVRLQIEELGELLENAQLSGDGRGLSA